MLHVCHVLVCNSVTGFRSSVWQDTDSSLFNRSSYDTLLTVCSSFYKCFMTLTMHHNVSEERLKNSQTSCFTVWHVVAWKFLLDSDRLLLLLFLTGSFRAESVVLNPSLENPSSPLDPVFNHFLLCFLFFFVLPVTAPQFHRPQREQRKTRRFNPLI